MTAPGRRSDEEGMDDALELVRGESALVAFQGERGAYGHLAIEQLWADRATVLPCRTFERVITSVQQGRASFGVLPVHNQIIGEIPGVRAAIAVAALDVIGHVRVEVRHCLLGAVGAQLDAVTEAFSHPAALAQCAEFFSQHPLIAACETYDTAGAAREVAARRRRTEGAIAAEGCAQRYGLQVLARDIGDGADNATHFAVVRRGA